MRKSLVLMAVLTVVACKGKEEASAPQPSASSNEAALQAASAAVALAQAAVAAASAAQATAAPTASASAVAAVSASASASAAVASTFPPQVANELGRLGFSTTPSDLTALGRDRSALLSGLSRLVGHASSLAAIFGNDKVVTAFTRRPDAQEFCRNPERLKQVLLFALSSPASKLLVNDPASIKALTGSRFGTELQNCPAFKTLAQQPSTLATLTADNAAAAAVVNNPNFRAELDRLEIRQDAKAPSRTFRQLGKR